MSNLPAQQQQNKLPKIEELYKDVELSSKHNDLQILLNQKPSEKWLKPHPTASTKDKAGNKVPVMYMPIEIVEWLLTSIFIKWKPEVVETKVMVNSISVTVRLHYLDPVTGEWDWVDGVGAQPIRTNQGASPTDFSQIQSTAVQTGLPAAKSYAIKDAAECLGRIFGKDLNRGEGRDYENMSSKFNSEEPLNA